MPSPALPTAARSPTGPLNRRLGRHHFAHLRAVAQGVDLIESARRYLGIEHGHQARSAHQHTADQVRAIARRHHENAWRLIGLRIPAIGADTAGQRPAPPSLEAFIDAQGLEGFSEAEVAEFYAEAYPPDARSARRQRLYERQFALLARLEALAAEVPSPLDAVHGWFDELLAAKLTGAGLLTLGDLNRKVSAGGKWFAALPGVGATKARRIESFLATLLPRETLPDRPMFALERSASLFAPPSPRPPASALIEVLPPELAAQVPVRLLDARDDSEAIESWIAARAGSEATREVYAREALRLRLWLRYERQGKTLAQMNVMDCRDFMAFLADVPERWISRTRAAPGEPGWAPFRGQLSHTSRQQAVSILAGLFSWLQSAQYLPNNPWVLVNRDFGDDPGKVLLDTRSFSEEAIGEILRFIEAQPPSPARSRIRFLVRFNEAVGMRASELLSARLSDLQRLDEGWMLQVHGKGSKERLAALPGQAMAALDDYLVARGLSLDDAPPEAPLVASTLDPMEPVGYTALYEHVRRWLRKAVMSSELTLKEKLRLSKASTHWLRHTFGARAVAREVPLDVIQAQMGHASVTTTMMYGRAPLKRRAGQLGAAFETAIEAQKTGG